MTRYAKLVNNELEIAPLNKGSILNYTSNKELLKQDGYKELLEVERPKTQRMYVIQYKESTAQIKEVIKYTETEEAYNSRMLANSKFLKHSENIKKAKEAVEQGYIEFKGALFETNTQTINDLDKERQLSIIEGKTSSTWLSMDDQIVELVINTENETEDDFVKIGFLVKAYKNNIWVNKYLAYKAQIEEATTAEDVNSINIDYTQDE